MLKWTRFGSMVALAAVCSCTAPGEPYSLDDGSADPSGEGEGEGDGEGEGEGEGEPRPAYFVADGKLYDPCGEELIIRGVNKMAVYADRSGESFPEIASVGANTVRFMWLVEVPASEAVQTLQRAIDEGLVPMWEIHDATGDFARMADVAAFWSNPQTIEVLRQFEARVIVNIANEGGNNVDDGTWVSTYQGIIASFRDAGLRMPLVIDAAGYGRNVEQLLALAPNLTDSDPLGNLMFAWHVYNPGQQEADRVDASIAQAQAANLAFLIGEFGPVSPGACSLEVPYLHVIEKAQEQGIGYLPWSWDNFNGDCAAAGGSAFDMVGDGIHADTLKAGYASEVVLTHPASIQNTSVLTNFQRTGLCG